MRLFLINIFLLFLFQTAVFAQEDAPKLGLVLSGGGAKGLAHISVIRALEEQGIYPDYITGTSMGALVGALYAIGYTPDEMEELISGIDWDQLLTNRVPLTEVTIEEKPYSERYLFELTWDNNTVSLPQGLIVGQRLNELFVRITRSVHNIDDFSQFPIPFACMATDITTGDKVQLDSGSLPDAMRASMAIPSFFTPVEIDGHLLVDGGLVRNFPVEEVRAMGADVVIGVFVSSDLKTKDELTDMVDVLAQSALIAGTLDSREQMKKTDFLLVPDLDGFYTQSFNKSADIIEAGKVYAETMTDSIRIFKETYLAGKEMKPVEKLPVAESHKISQIVIEGNDKVSSEFIVGKLGIDPTESMSYSNIERRINLLFGTRFFSKISYTIKETNGQDVLFLSIEEAPQKKINFSVNYDTENGVGVNSNLTVRNLLIPNSRWIAEGNLAENPGLELSYYQYLGVEQGLAFVAGGLWKNSSLPDYNFSGSTSNIFKSTYYNLYSKLQTANHQHFTFGAHFSLERGILKPKIGEEIHALLEKFSLENRSAGLFFDLNTLDKRYFTEQGLSISANASYKFSTDNAITFTDSLTPGSTPISILSDNYYQASLDIKSFHKLLNHFSFSVQGTVVLSDLEFDSINLIDYQFIGGFNPRYQDAYSYWGSSDREFNAISFSKITSSLQYEVQRDIYLQGLFNYIDSEYPMELLGIKYDKTDFEGRDRRYGAGISAGYNSKFGPIILGLAKDFHKNSVRAYFSIGYYF